MSDATCKHPDGCPLPVRANGWCKRHYQRIRLKGDPGPAGLIREPAPDKCTYKGCDNPYFANGYCEKHRWRVRHHGDPADAALKQRPKPHTPKKREPKICRHPDGCPRTATRDGWCAMHYERIRRTGVLGPAEPMIGPRGSGTIDKKGYRRINTPDGRRVMEHVYVMEQHKGRRLRPGETVHHKHGLRHENGDIADLELWVTVQPRGQRVSDLVEFVIRQYPDELERRGWHLA